MRVSDIGYVLSLAAKLYPDHPESRSAFEAKLAACPDACLVADRDGTPVGYCAALWATCGRPPKLDETAYAPRSPLGLHLHDISLDPAVRGRGLVGSALAHLSRLAGPATLSLIAVNGTRPLWQRHGFRDAPVDEDVRTTYGSDAVYMARGP